MRASALLLFALFACGPKSAPTEPDEADASAPSATAQTPYELLLEVGSFDALPARMELADGLVVELLERGRGPLCEPGDDVEAHLRVLLASTGGVVDSTQGKPPFRLTLDGRTTYIQGLHRAIPGLRVGTTVRVQVPAELAYGERGSPASGIGPNEPLVLEVQIVGVRG